MKSITAPRKTENVLPKPVGAFTSLLWPLIMCCQVSSCKTKGVTPFLANLSRIIVYPADPCNCMEDVNYRIFFLAIRCNFYLHIFYCFHTCPSAAGFHASLRLVQ